MKKYAFCLMAALLLFVLNGCNAMKRDYGRQTMDGLDNVGTDIGWMLFDPD